MLTRMLQNCTRAFLRTSVSPLSSGAAAVETFADDYGTESITRFSSVTVVTLRWAVDSACVSFVKF
jgi:hypothetical protein